MRPIELKELSELTEIPYTTLREWDKKRYSGKEDWRVKLLEYLEDVKGIEERSIKKIVDLFTYEEFEVVCAAIFAHDTPIEFARDWKSWLDSELEHYFYYKLDEDYNDLEGSRRAGIRRAIEEKVAKICEFDVFALYRYIYSFQCEDGSIDIKKAYEEAK